MARSATNVRISAARLGRGETRTNARARARDLEQLALWLDGRFTILGTDIRFGVDAMIGLFPGIGDALSAAISLYIVSRARALGAPPEIIRKMIRNVAIDAIIGAVPILGDMFDIAFKANIKNVNLLLDYLERG